MVIRKESAEDKSSVYQVVSAAFDRPDEANLVNRLRPLSGVISLVAELDSSIIGHIMFSPVSYQDDAGQITEIKIAGLAPVAVSPDHQKMGVGKALIEAGINVCKEAGYVACVLIGHPEYYPQFGFQPAESTYELKSTYNVPDPVFMARELVSGALKLKSGTIYYHPIFEGI